MTMLCATLAAAVAFAVAFPVAGAPGGDPDASGVNRYATLKVSGAAPPVMCRLPNWSLAWTRTEVGVAALLSM